MASHTPWGGAWRHRGHAAHPGRGAALKLHDILLRTLAVLDELGVEGALLGGLAVSVWSEPRFTRDVDLAVAVRSDAEAETLIQRLQHNGFSLVAVVEQKAAARLATARLIPPGEDEQGIIVDLLFASSGIEPEIVADAPVVEIGAGTPVKVVRPGHLVVLKLLAHDAITRPQDGMDLAALRSVLDDAESARAREACDLVHSRGFHRGRDLRALLEAFLGAK